MMYRVVKTICDDFSGKVIESVVWSGHDISELSRDYPKSDIMGADPLGYSEIEGGMVRSLHRFERFLDDDWVKIDDPRKRTSESLTEIEIVIEAENRRLYPGDYM